MDEHRLHLWHPFFYFVNDAPQEDMTYSASYSKQPANCRQVIILRNDDSEASTPELQTNSLVVGQYDSPLPSHPTPPFVQILLVVLSKWR